jgi:phosphohistidine phosphatase SixA
MKHLFLVRHGNYDYDNGEYHLSPRGQREMETLSELMKKIVGEDFYICSSPEAVAIESARILAEKLGVVQPEEAMDLWSGSLGPAESNVSGNPQRVHDYLMGNKDKASSLVAVSHLEVAEKYPTYFWKNELGQEGCAPKPAKGQMVHFDLEQKTYELLPC